MLSVPQLCIRDLQVDRELFAASGNRSYNENLFGYINSPCQASIMFHKWLDNSGMRLVLMFVLVDIRRYAYMHARNLKFLNLVVILSSFTTPCSCCHLQEVLSLGFRESTVIELVRHQACTFNKKPHCRTENNNNRRSSATLGRTYNRQISTCHTT